MELLAKVPAPTAARLTKPTHPDTDSMAGRSQEPFRLLLVHGCDRTLTREIADLQSCGLPANTEALVLTVPDPFNSSPYQIDTRSDSPRNASHQELELASQLARKELLAAFPLWNVQSAASSRPDRAVLEHALSWQPDLVILGLTDKSAARSRAFRGLLRKLVTESRISVRAQRAPAHIWSFRRPIVIALDGRASVDAVLTALRRRRIAPGSEVKLLLCSDSPGTDAVPSKQPHAGRHSEWIASQLLHAKAAIEPLGYRVSSLVPIDNTAQAILAQAQRIDAEAIIIGKAPRDVLGDLAAQSVAASVVANADCSVEIACASRARQCGWASQVIAA